MFIFIYILVVFYFIFNIKFITNRFDIPFAQGEEEVVWF